MLREVGSIHATSAGYLSQILRLRFAPRRMTVLNLAVLISQLSGILTTIRCYDFPALLTLNTSLICVDE